VDFGTMLALKAGFTVQRHRELGRFRDSAAFSELEKAALTYADATTDLPMAVTDEMVDVLRERLGDAGLVELTYMIALENMRPHEPRTRHHGSGLHQRIGQVSPRG
jgi:alkylhydroperoxidase family enzyme